MSELTADDIMTRFAEPFARALAVFVRECSKAGTLPHIGDIAPASGGIEHTESVEEYLARQLARTIRENERLAAAGKLESFEVNEDSASKAVATRLRWMIKERGVNQTKLAEMVGVAPAAISRVLKNPDRSKVDTLRKIARALDVDLRQIL